MFRNVIIILLNAVALVAATDWKLVWSDEFSKPGLPDASKWNYEQGFIRNGELQYYTKERQANSRIENGMLIIEAKKEPFKNPSFDPKSKNGGASREYAQYTAASLVTQGKAEWTYGRFEVRAKLPTGTGTWPAIWMLGTNIDQVGWPTCGEIDIMENVGFMPDTIHANIHTKAYNHMIGTNKGAKIRIPKPWNAFHVYAMEWYTDHMDFFVDDVKYFSFANEAKGNDVWPYDKPHYLILNFAVGGAWGGARGMDPNIFPQKFIIDYVRVYQK